MVRIRYTRIYNALLILATFTIASSWCLCPAIAAEVQTVGTESPKPAGGLVSVSAKHKAPDSRISIALSDLIGQGIDESSCAIISDRLRVELSKTGAFKVLERPEMQQILKEQGFQQTGACSDNACLVQMGQLLGIGYMVSGTIGKLEGLFTITIHVIDVAGGETILTDNVDCECTIAKVLTTSTVEIARKIADKYGKVQPVKVVSIPAPAPGVETVKSPPPEPVPAPVPSKSTSTEYRKVNGLRPAISGKELEGAVAALCDSLLRGLPDSLRGGRVAVLPLTDNSADGVDQGRSIAELLVARLQKTGFFVLVDRMEMQKAMAEIALSQTGIMDQSQELTVGAVLSARFLIVGSVSRTNELFTVSARLLNTESQQVVAAAALCSNTGAMNLLAKEILGERAHPSSALFRSLLIPGWGQFYAGHPGRGTISMVVCLGALGVTGYSLFATNSAYQSYKDQDSYMRSSAFVVDVQRDPKNYQIARNELQDRYDIYSSDFDLMLISSAITGGLWVLNCLDATIAGAQAKKRLAPYFASNFHDAVQAGVALSF